MQHIFSSGEVLYEQNVKVIDEGKLTAEAIAYENISENENTFECTGTIENRRVLIRFQLDQSGQEKILYKSRMHILMASDILRANWKCYSLTWVECDDTL